MSAARTLPLSSAPASVEGRTAFLVSELQAALSDDCGVRVEQAKDALCAHLRATAPARAS